VQANALLHSRAGRAGASRAVGRQRDLRDLGRPAPARLRIRPQGTRRRPEHPNDRIRPHGSLRPCHRFGDVGRAREDRRRTIATPRTGAPASPRPDACFRVNPSARVDPHRPLFASAMSPQQRRRRDCRLSWPAAQSRSHGAVRLGGRRGRLFVKAGVSFRLIGVLKLLTKESQATSTRTPASPRSLARSLQAPRPAGSPYPRRLSHKPNRLYESDNGRFRRSRESDSGGQSGSSATETVHPRIDTLSQMYKKSRHAMVCATASAREGSGPALSGIPVAGAE
jgi:hypothetical protein